MWNQYDTWKFRPNMYSKRKPFWDPIYDETPPPKMHITEEKMVSQLNSIHLSADFTSHGSAQINVDESPMAETETLPKLTICEELKTLKPPNDPPLLPRQLLEKCRRPTNALVLWQPPAGDLGKYLGTIREMRNEEESEEEKRPAQQENVARDVDMMEDDNNNNNNNGGVSSNDLNTFFTRTI